ncbi:CoA transferase [Hoeflea sp. WL0058]|uniref:CoA transferase n=1 Tax=Flavimaribacter sediminis TaxID=2865987 RepID=A0AAE2ZT65_9HYPH|nr:CaiB/BaiF CoA-transferase family protein [Flavimaribacter sediminis]MBW8640093.1 CoA transferase [Flavimaribacter sediminis]
MSKLFLPLEGMTVVTLEQAVAAPYCTSRLADAGATVIKIERPEGDFARDYDKAAGGQCSYFVWLNRGKQSVVLDLTVEADRGRLAELISGAEIVVQNLRHGVAKKFGFAPEDLCRRDPALVCCSITGFDPAGPMARRKAYDLLIQAESGLASVTGGPDEPARVGVSVVDVATGATAYAAVLEAVIGRLKTGKGANITVSMFDVMADWMTVPLIHTEAGNPPKRIGLAHPSIAPYGVFRTGDDKDILVSVQSEREWVKFCRNVLRREDLLTDPVFQDNTARATNRKETDALVAEIFLQRDLADLIANLDASDIAYAVVNDTEGLSKHPELRRILVKTPSGEVSYPAPAARFAGSERKYGPVPAVGENSLSRADKTKAAGNG